MFEIGKLPSLDLGYQGENKVRTIDIDMTAWLEEYPGSKVALMVKRPDEDTYYPAGKMEGSVLLWVIDRADRQYAGRGEAQIILTNKDDVELRSRIVKTKISPSLTGTEVEAPPPQQTWVGEVLQAAQKAEEAVGHMPVIGENGNWYAWDADEDAYEDTGRPSKGERGLTGPQGDKGDTGPQGPKGDKGETGATGPKGDTGPAGPKGDKGDTGERGPKGDTGATGPRGEQGPAGKDGTGVTILGSYTSLDALKTAHPTGSPGDAYLIEGYLYVWSASDNEWKNVGKIQGPQGERGPKGETGDTGPTGPKGDKGDTGATGPAGEPGAPGHTPVAGTDYYTAADKAELVEAVKSQIGEVDGDYAPAIHADQHSWNDTLTWDGDETGRITAVISAYNGEEDKVVLLSEKVPTTADLANGYFIAAYNAETGRHEKNEHSLDDVGVNSDGAMMLPDGGYIFIIPTDNYVYKEFHGSFTFPKAGVYLMYGVYDGVVSYSIKGFTIPGYNFIKSTDPITPEMIGAAPSNHASESYEYGIGTDKKYGHLKIADLGDVFTSGETNLLDIAIELPTGDPMIDLKPYALGASTGYAVINYLVTYVNDHDVVITEHNSSIRNLQNQTLKQADRQSIITDALAALAGADPNNANAAVIETLIERTSTLERKAMNMAEDIAILQNETDEFTAAVVGMILKIVFRLVQLERNAGLQPPASDEFDTKTELDDSYDDYFGQS